MNTKVVNIFGSHNNLHANIEERARMQIEEQEKEETEDREGE